MLKWQGVQKARFTHLVLLDWHMESIAVLMRIHEPDWLSAGRQGRLSGHARGVLESQEG